jgi:hypothetical protein
MLLVGGIFSGIPGPILGVVVYSALILDGSRRRSGQFYFDCFLLGVDVPENQIATSVKGKRGIWGPATGLHLPGCIDTPCFRPYGPVILPEQIFFVSSIPASEQHADPDMLIRSADCNPLP